jgi:hypothetical protein
MQNPSFVIKAMTNPKRAYYKNSHLKYKEWVINGKFHRETGPAYITYYKNGQVETETWFLNGAWHRLDGPAYIRYDKNGQVKNEVWWLFNKQVEPIKSPIHALVEIVKILGKVPRDMRAWAKKQGISNQQTNKIRKNVLATETI